MSKHRPTPNPYAPEQPKKKRSKWLTVGIPAVVVVGILAVATTGGDKDTSAPATSNTPAAEQTTDGDTLTFTAETSDGSTASITYAGADMQITQNQDVPTPWSVDIPGLNGKWDAMGANVTVQQNGSGNVTCHVLWNGEEVATNTSSGPYSIATCNLPM